MTLNLSTLNDAYKRYHSSTIDADVDLNETGQMGLDMLKLCDGLAEFIRDSKDKCDNITGRTKPHTVYRNKHGAKNKWKMTFSWGEAKTNPIIHCQLTLNGDDLFETFYLQKSMTFNDQLNVTIHWSSKLRSPQSLIEYDILIWGGQITMSCLHDLFLTTLFTPVELQTLRLKGFNSLPIRTISKSFALFEKECINLKGLPKTKKAKHDFVRSFFTDIGFEFRALEDDFVYYLT